MVAPLQDGPYNLLSLDGGGIRGVSELVILHKIMQKIQEKEKLAELPKPCDYFHLIGGTSTGGLVALLVGRLRLSTQEALDAYDELAESIFRRRNMRFSLSSRFGEEPLAKAVRDLVARINANEMMKDPADDGHHRMGRAFVCALPAQNQRAPKRIRGYVADDDWDKEIKIWEAARATTAAPSYFKPMTVKSGTLLVELIDAAMGFNNPTAEVLSEAMEILDPSCKLGCVVSLGTGTREKHLKGSWTRTLQAVKLMKSVTTDSDRVEDEVQKIFARIPSTYFRFSVPNAAAKIGMAKYKQIGELKEMTLEYLDSTAEAEIEEVAEVLSKRKTQGWVLGNLVPNEKYSRVDKSRANSGGVATKFFTGRGEILEKLSLFFSKRENNPVPRREFLLYGMGGVGKTQIALKFRQLMDAEERFNHIFFVDATDEATIEECYLRISSDLDIEKGNISKLLRWMATTKDEWLLILDNCPDEDFSRYLPDSDRGNVLYTSRRNVMKRNLPDDSTLEVEVMGESDAVALLLKVSHQQLGSEEPWNLALPIVKELGCLPLAIEQAGASIFTMHYSLKEYLEILVKQKSEMMRYSELYSNAQTPEKAVYTTFDVSYEDLRSLSKMKKGSIWAEHAEMALKILSTICFYHNEHILEDIFEHAAHTRLYISDLDPERVFDLGSGKFRLDSLVDADEEGDWKPNQFRSAVALLESLSLVKRDTRTHSLSMHVLVHSWARDRMEEPDRVGYSTPARNLLLSSIGVWEEHDFLIQFHRKVWPHILACQRNVKARGEPFVEIQFHASFARLLQDISLEHAVKEWKKVVTECTPEATGHDEARWDAMFQLVEGCKKLGRFSEAEELATTIYTHMRGKYGESHLETLRSIYALAKVHRSMWDIPNAIRYCQIGADICKQNDDLREIFRFEELLEIHLETLQKMEEQRRQLQELTDRIERGELHPLAKDEQHNAYLDSLSSSENLAESVGRLWENYELFMDSYGPYSEKVCQCLRSLLFAYMGHRHVSCSEIIAREAIGRCTKYLGEFHPETIVSKSHLALVWSMDGRSREGVAFQRECVEQLISSVGGDSQFTNVALINLQLCANMRKDEENYIKTARRFPKELRAKRFDGERLWEFNHCGELPCGKSGHQELLERLKFDPDDSSKLVDAFGGIDNVWGGAYGTQDHKEDLDSEQRGDSVTGHPASEKEEHERAGYLALGSKLPLHLLSTLRKDEPGKARAVVEQRGDSRKKSKKQKDKKPVGTGRVEEGSGERNHTAGKIDRKGKRPEVIINLVGNYVK